MATTHALAGVTLAVPLLIVAPEVATIALLAGCIGGLWPDLDVSFNHRRTLHFPVLYPACAVFCLCLALRWPSMWTIALATATAAAALHTTMDILGGGLELRPWQATSDLGVYSHVHGRWIRPRRWIRYDGAPEDLAVVSILAVPPLLISPDTLQAIIVVLVAISAVYVVARKRVATIAEAFVDDFQPA